MAFKMKGPGLPGFRKQVGRGFYKSSGFNINTSNRSPIKEGEKEDEDKQVEQDAIDKARKEYLKYIEEGGDPNKVDWDDKVVEVKQDVKNRTTTTTTEESQFGTISAGNETIGGPKMSNEDWEKFVKENPDWNTKKVFRGQVDVDEKTTKPDIEWSNVTLGRSMIGHGSGTVKHDNNDGTFRYNIELASGQNFGELSAADIDEKVKKGEWKHEMKHGKATGRILMSKDYHENVYQPLIQIGEDRETNYNDWVDQSAQFRSDAIKSLNSKLEEQGIRKNKRVGKGNTEEWSEAFRQGMKEVKEENPKMYPKRGLPEWMHNDPNYPASYNQPKIGIYNDDEMVSNYTNYTKDDEGKWVMKEGASGISHEAYNSMTLEEQEEIQKNLNSNSKKGKGATGTDGVLRAPTPSHLANKGDYATGSEEEMRIDEREIEE